MVGDAGAAGVDLGATELLGRDVLAGRRLHQRRPAEEDRPGAADDDRLVAHRRHVRAAGRARAHDQRHLGDPGGRHPGLVVEDPAEVVAVREDLGLERQERPARIDQVDARQPVLEGDLLGPQVLLDRHRVVGAALDRGVVGDDHAGGPLDATDAGDDPGARRIVVVQAGGGERAQLEERRARVEESLDAFADGELAAFAMARDRAFVAARAAARDGRLSRAKVRDECGQRIVIGARLGGGGIEPAAQDGHGSDDRREPSATGDRRAAMQVTVRLLAVVALVFGLAACAAPAASPSAATPAGPLVTVETRGGECPAGACGQTITIDRDGRVHLAAKPPNDLGTVTPEVLDTLQA